MLSNFKNTAHKLESLLVQAKAIEKVESVIREHWYGEMNEYNKPSLKAMQFELIEVTAGQRWIAEDSKAVTACTRNLKTQKCLNSSSLFSGTHPDFLTLPNSFVCRTLRHKHFIFLFCSAKNITPWKKIKCKMRNAPFCTFLTKISH